MPGPPLNVEFVCLYIAHLHFCGLKYSTIRSSLSGLAYVHKMSGTSDPTTDPPVTKTLQGVRNIERRGPGQNQLLPITKPILHALLDAIPFCLNSSYQQHMFRALFLLCFYSCLRVGEAVHSTSAAHTLTVSQVTKQDSGFTITLKSYKHSRASRDPIPKLVLETVQGPHCPVAALNKYLACRPACEGPLFLNEQGSPVNRNSLVNVLRHCLSLCGLPVTRYNTHSFRIGRATQLAIEGYSDDYIRRLGRWKTNAYQEYIRIQQLTLPK